MKLNGQVQVGAVLRSESFLNSMDDGNGTSKRKPLKIARNVFIHYDEIDIDGEKVMGVSEWKMEKFILPNWINQMIILK